MVALGFSRPETYIISTTGTTSSLASSSNCSIGNNKKTTKLRSPTTTIMVKTLAVANSPTKLPTTANIIKTTTLSSPVHRFLSPRQSLALSSSTATTTAKSSLSLPLQQQKHYSCSSSTNSSWTTILGGHSDSEDSQSSPTSPGDSSNCGEPKKRRRLTHLSPEEKILRRKLKNRVAAQTARDRKKAQMNDMEETIANLQAENKKLLQYNGTLQKKSYDLSAENAELRRRLGLLENGECSVSSPASESVELVKTEPKSPWSAEETGSDSVSFDNAIHLLPESADLLSLLDEVCNSDAGACLDHCPPSPISSTTECNTKEEEGSVVTCPVQSTNQMVGSSPTQLDSLNELIKSDHFYVKCAPSSDEESILSLENDADEVSLREEEVEESSPFVVPLKELETTLSLTENCFSLEENDMTLLQDFMKECLSNKEGTVSDEFTDISSLKNDQNCDLVTEEAKISTPIPATRKRMLEEEFSEVVNKLPRTGSICDSGNESGIHSDCSSPGSPYQQQLLQFDAMNPVDDILFPELFPCFI